MKEKSIRLTVLLIAILWQLLVFIKLPHLTWIPGFLNTWLYQQGLIPYKDFVDPHFPLSYLMMYPWLLLTNWHWETDPILALVIAILTLITIYYFGQRMLKTSGLIVALIFFSIYYWYFSTWVQISQEAIQGLMILPLLFFLLRSASRLISLKAAFFFGVGVAVLELTGQIVTPTAAIMLIILVALVVKQVGRSKKLTKYLLSLAAGLLLPVTVVSSYFAFRGALGDFFFWNISYYLTYAKLSQVNPGIPPWSDILIFSSSLVVLALALISKQLPQSRRSSIWIVFLLGLVSLPAITLAIFHPHHFLFALPIMALAVGLATQIAWEIPKLKLIGLLMLGLILWQAGSIVLPNLTSRFITGWQPRVLTAGQDLNQQQAIDWLVTHPSKHSRILVVGDPLFYFRSNRLPANSRFTVLPWHYLPLGESKKVIDQQPPTFWVIDKNYLQRLVTGWKTPQIAEFIEDELSRCYQQVFSNLEWLVWERRC